MAGGNWRATSVSTPSIRDHSADLNLSRSIEYSKYDNANGWNHQLEANLEVVLSRHRYPGEDRVIWFGDRVHTYLHQDMEALRLLKGQSPYLDACRSQVRATFSEY